MTTPHFAGVRRLMAPGERMRVGIVDGDSIGAGATMYHPIPWYNWGEAAATAFMMLEWPRQGLQTSKLWHAA